MYEQSRIRRTFEVGSHSLEEEVGRWNRVPKDERICKLLNRDVVKKVQYAIYVLLHFIPG